MKINKLIVAAMCGILTFAACSNNDGADEANYIAGGDKDGAVLEINLLGGSSEFTRAGEPERVLHTATIFALDGNGRIVKSFYEADLPSKTTPNTYKVSITTKKVVVIGNAGDLTSVTGYMGDLEAIVKKINDLTDVGTKGIWMTGISTETFTFSEVYAADPELKQQSTSIDMHLIPAKVTIKAVNDLKSPTDLTIKNVSFLYSGQYTHLMPQRAQAVKYNDMYAPTFAEVAAMTPATTYYVSGISWLNESSVVRGGTVYTPLTTAWNGAANFEQTYYVLPGNVVTGSADYSNAIATITTERSVTKPTPHTETEYFSIFFNESTKHVGSYLSSGKHYTITLTLKNDPSGPPTPEIEPDAIIKLSIAIDDWDPITVSKEFE